MSRREKWVLVLVSLLCIVALTAGTIAAYTNVEAIKRVVSTKKPGADVRFSSNHLTLCDRSAGSYPNKLISVGTQVQLQFPVSICNYPQEDITRVNEETIVYTLEVSLVDLQGNPISGETTVEYQIEDGTTQTITGADLSQLLFINGQSIESDSCSKRFINNELPGGQASTQSFRISCADGSVLCFSQVMVQIKAVPENTAGGLAEKMLAGCFRFVVVSAQSNQWTGRFVDESLNTTNLDAFNYELSGTAQGKLRLSWNPNYVEPSLWALEDMGVSLESDIHTDTNDMSYFEIEVGGSDDPSQYLLQFYRTNGIPDNETWENVKTYVTCTFPVP